MLLLLFPLLLLQQLLLLLLLLLFALALPLFLSLPSLLLALSGVHGAHDFERSRLCLALSLTLVRTRILLHSPASPLLLFGPPRLCLLLHTQSLVVPPQHLLLLWLLLLLLLRLLLRLMLLLLLLLPLLVGFEGIIRRFKRGGSVLVCAHRLA